MRDGVIIANSGHFNVEINLETLKEMAVEVRTPRPSVQQYVLPDGRRVNLLAEGRLVNLSAAEGHPSAVMDMSFANQALCVEYLATQSDPRSLAVHPVPKEIDRRTAVCRQTCFGRNALDAFMGKWRKSPRTPPAGIWR
jgi:adenosylhomocysteinase